MKAWFKVGFGLYAGWHIAAFIDQVVCRTIVKVAKEETANKEE